MALLDGQIPSSTAGAFSTVRTQRPGWKVALTYAAASLGILIILFDYMSPTLWYPALLRWW